jgi:P-type conjugative transfer protein TrbL
MNKSVIVIIVLVAAMMLTSSADAAVTTNNVIHDVISRYQTAASKWAGTIVGHATFMFWALVAISMVWTFGIMAIRQAGLNEFFAEFVRFILFTGFFNWLLINGATGLKFAPGIVDSMRQLGGTASGLGTNFVPNDIVTIGFDIFSRAVDQLSVWNIADSLIGFILSLLILIILTIVAVNIVVTMITAWILMYAGVFFLGFGGSRWTSDLAINYYKAVLAIGASLFAMTLLVGIGVDILNQYYTSMSGGVDFREMGVVLVASIVLLFLVDKVPTLIAGMVTGSSIGQGIGSFGSGAAMGAMGMAMAGAGMAGSALAAGAQNIGGGIQALKSAVDAATAHAASGEGMFSGAGASSGPRSYSEAMGHSARFAADVGANLAKGSWDVGREKVGGAIQSFSQAARETLPGQVATAIDNSGGQNDSTGSRTPGGGSTGSENSIGPGSNQQQSMDPEVAAFVNKGSESNG